MNPIVASVEVRRIARLSPSFVRVWLGDADPTDSQLADSELAQFGVDGPLYDQRIKLVFPRGDGTLPDLAGASWWQQLSELPEEERSPVRTYTVRDVVGSGADTLVIVDFVVHPGAHGPGSDWASQAAVGDRIVLVGPRRGAAFGGIEFAPGDATRVVLAGDETAVPAIAAILSMLPAHSCGAAFLEVPVDADVQELIAPSGMTVCWLPRNGASPGALMHAAVLAHLGTGDIAPVDVPDAEVDPTMWETPIYSSSGEAVAVAGTALHSDVFAWIAGESKAVTGLRRALVNRVGLDRSRVAFMGYWRIGVAMRG